MCSCGLCCSFVEGNCYGSRLLVAPRPAPLLNPPPPPPPHAPFWLPPLQQQQQPQAADFTNEYWAQIARLRNKYLGDLKNFYEVTLPPPPNPLLFLVPLAAALPREHAPITHDRVSLLCCSLVRRWSG